MGLETIGKNMRKFRVAKKLRQEDLAELTGLSTNYIGSLERGEKVPSLETFITIVNCLGASADMILADVVDTKYSVRASMLAEQMENLPQKERARIYDVVEVLVRHGKRV